jgi:hypothetical protein
MFKVYNLQLQSHTLLCKVLWTILIEHHLQPYILSFNNIMWHPSYGSMQKEGNDINIEHTLITVSNKVVKVAGIFINLPSHRMIHE